MPLQGKHALITGSSRGIGRGIALKLAEHGVNVAVHYHTQADAANETLAQVKAHGAEGCLIQADVTRPEEISRMFERVQREFGTLDIFVSNARPEFAAFYQPPLALTLDGNVFTHNATALNVVQGAPAIYTRSNNTLRNNAGGDTLTATPLAGQ